MKHLKTTCRRLASCLLAALCATAWGQSGEPLRIGVAGVSHGHLWEVIKRIDQGDFQIVGVAEENDSLRTHNGLRGKVAPELFYKDLGEMLDKTRPEAVVVYEPIFDHLRVVEECAPRGIDVMVEKPLAVNAGHAERMAELARANDILLLTNYETTWYATNHEAFRLVANGAIGKVRRIEVYDGHQGPFEINCGKEFTDWLTDPTLNGGGAVIDFGCYGANLATRLMGDERPLSVYAVLRQNKPDRYPRVDDDATIIVNYPSAVVQIMGSWCWPMGRKDMHVYGERGYIYQDTPTAMRVLEGGEERRYDAPALPAPYDDSFRFLRAATRGEIDVPATDLSSLENNLWVVRILDAAIRSAREKRVVYMSEYPTL